MPFVNYDSLNQNYPSGYMNENMNLLKDFDKFHCLLACNTERAASVKNRVINLPDEYLKWLNVCDGGILFDTTMLTTKSHDDTLNLDFFTYGNFFKEEIRQKIKLSENWFIFAFAVHDDVFFFDTDIKDGRVYQWDIEEHNIYAFWESFEDWLSDQIHEGIGLIADELLYPVGIKLEVSENE